MSKSKALEFTWLECILTGKAITNVCATAGTTDNWLALHTADPDQAVSTANEGGYDEYTRIAVDRSTAAGGWTVTSNATTDPTPAYLVSAISFPQQTGSTANTFTHFSVHPTSVSTGDDAFFFGTITPNITGGANVTPILTTAGTITEQ